MALTRCTCPSCHTTLKLSAPAPEGKRIKCPRCATVFPVGGEEALAAAGTRAQARPAADDWAVLERDRLGGAAARSPDRAARAPGPRVRSPERDADDKGDQDSEEGPATSPRRRPARKSKKRKASLALRVSVLILAVIGGLFSGGLGMAWLAQASSPEVQTMRKLASTLAEESGAQEVKDNLARLDRMVRSSYFLLLAAPLGVVGGVLVVLGRTRLGGALMLAAVPVPLALSTLTLMSLYFLLVGGVVALLTPSWPRGGGPSRAVMALLIAGGWVVVLSGWVVVILALPKPGPEVEVGPVPAAVPPGPRASTGGGPPGPTTMLNPRAPKPQPPASSEQAATPITAEELTRAYLADRDAADRKFKGKLLVAAGTVHFNFIGRPDWFSIELNGVKKGDGRVLVLVCFLRKDLQGKISPDAVHESEAVRLKGRCTGLDSQGRPCLADCELVPGTSPPGAGTAKGNTGGQLPAAFDWKEFKDPGGHYTVLMPGTPRQDLPGFFTVAGMDLAGLKGNLASYSFTVSYDRRENEERTWEDQVKDWREANTSRDAKPQMDRAIQVKGHPGWEIVYVQPKKEYRQAWIVKLKQGVALVSTDLPDGPDWFAADGKFFDSFTPIDTGTAGTPSPGPAAPAAPAEPGSPPPAKADVIVTPEEIAADFNRGADAAVAKYAGKEVEVTGRVTGYVFGSLDASLRLAGSGPGEVSFNFVCRDRRLVEKAMPGQTVTLRGRCQPILGIPDWTIVKVTGSPPPTFTATELARQYAANQKGTSAKIGGKYVVVTGTVTQVQNGGNIVLLTAPGKRPEVICRFDPDYPPLRERARPFRAGDKVKLLGESITGEPDLSRCYPLGGTP